MKEITKYLMTYFILSVLVTGFICAQPDLTLKAISNTPVNLGLGQILNITLNVQNIGTSSASRNHISIFISPTKSFTNAVYLSQISLESLSAGASSGDIQFVYPVPYNVPSGTNYVLVAVDALNEVTESNENNNDFYSNKTLNISSSVKQVQKLPYPMIFIHGLIGSNQTWDTLLIAFQKYYGWSYGGNMNFCLNQDANLSTSVIASDYHDYTKTSNLFPADFYTVNFDVDQFGKAYTGGNNSAPIKSNQSAIVKQGRAIKDAIAHVLKVSGKDKVILVGHSMGGLSAREYLQNPNIWQSDGKHHVAKLLTIGTPNGGSNSTSFGLGIGNIDEKSEAVRDLRYQYSVSLDAGVYLFGGIESFTVMNNSILWDYYNVDVNCNGSVPNNIIGLNNKSIPKDVSYACVIGTGSLLGGDGVVASSRADLNTYPGLIYADTFNLVEPAPIFGGVWHTELPKQIRGNVQGIDEANEYEQAYDIFPDQLYFGIISKQSKSPQSYIIDYDDYKINVSAGKLNIKIFNIPVSQFRIDIVNSSFTSVFTMFSNGKSYIDANTTLNAGKYYIELSGTPTDDSWYFPYAFKLTYDLATNVKKVAINSSFSCVNYPNPFSSSTTISFTLSHSDLVTIKVYNLFGQLISILTNENMNEGEHKIEFDGSSLSSGVYVYTIRSGKNFETHKITVTR
jgi:pimeloyl-ACP methyl ester carboxylesterase